MTFNKILRYSILTGLFIIPFTALVVTSSMSFPFITGKNFLFRVIMEILFGLWLILLYRDQEARPTKSWLLWAVVAYFVVQTLATIFSVNPARSFWSNFERMEGLVSYLHLFLYFLMLISVVRSEKLWHWFWHTFLASAIIMGTYGLFQLSGLYQIHQGGVRLDATLGNATYLSVFMLFAIFIATVYWFRQKEFSLVGIAGAVFGGLNISLIYALLQISKTGSAVTPLVLSTIIFVVVADIVLLSLRPFSSKETYKNYLYGFVVLFCSFILYQTATRGTILGLLGGAALALVLIALWRSGRTRKISLVALAVMAVLIGSFVLLRNSSLIHKSPVLSRFANISLSDSTTQSRFLIWNMSWQGFKEHPVLGWGPENYMLVFQKYYSPEMWKQEPWFDRSHNVIFDQLINAGLFGLLTYLLIFAAALYYLWRKRKGLTEDAPNRSLVVKCVITGLLFAYFFQNIFVFDNLTSYLLFYALLAYLYVSYSQPVSLPVAAASHLNYNHQKQSNFAPLTLPLALVAIIISLFSLYYFSARGIAVSQTLITGITPKFVDSDGKSIPADQAAKIRLESFKKIFQYRNVIGLNEAVEQLVQTSLSAAGDSAVNDVTKQNFISFSNQIAEQFWMRDPVNARLGMIYGAFLNGAGRPALAIPVLTKAHELSPKKQLILFELGLAYLKNQEPDRSLATFKEAYELDPSYMEAHRLYALIALSTGQTALGNQIIGQGQDRLEVINDDRFVNYYANQKNYGQLILIWRERYKSNPKDQEAMLSLTGSYYYNGESDQAIVTVEGFVATNPEFKTQGEDIISKIKTGQISPPTN